MAIALDILNEIVTDGTGIEVTQDEALRAMKQIAELVFDAGYMQSTDEWNGETHPLGRGTTREISQYYENKRNAIQQLFPNK